MKTIPQRPPIQPTRGPRLTPEIPTQGARVFSHETLITAMNHLKSVHPIEGQGFENGGVLEEFLCPGGIVPIEDHFHTPAEGFFIPQEDVLADLLGFPEVTQPEQVPKVQFIGLRPSMQEFPSVLPRVGGQVEGVITIPVPEQLPVTIADDLQQARTHVRGDGFGENDVLESFHGGRYLGVNVDEAGPWP